MEIQSIDEGTARGRLAETDVARERFVRDIYGLDPTDPGLYTLVLDGTAFTTAACVDLITAAAQAPRRAPAPVA
jgi:cytidylate kinase